MIRNGKIAIGTAALLLVAVALVVLGENRRPAVVRAQTAMGGPIHGYVAAALAPALPTAVVVNRGPIINLPDINVFTKNIKTRVSSGPVKTNTQGYFRTATLPPGEYQVCVEGAGYT